MLLHQVETDQEQRDLVEHLIAQVVALQRVLQPGTQLVVHLLADLGGLVGHCEDLPWVEVELGIGVADAQFGKESVRFHLCELETLGTCVADGALGVGVLPLRPWFVDLADRADQVHPGCWVAAEVALLLLSFDLNVPLTPLSMWTTRSLVKDGKSEEDSSHDCQTEYEYNLH